MTMPCQGVHDYRPPKDEGASDGVVYTCTRCGRRVMGEVARAYMAGVQDAHDDTPPTVAGLRPHEYQNLALRTESTDGARAMGRLGRPGNIRLLHALLGIQSEAGELADAMKRYLFYGQDRDEENIVEELGDLLWYISVGLSALGVSMDTAMELNIKKLRERYPEGFSDESAAARADKRLDPAEVATGVSNLKTTRALDSFAMGELLVGTARDNPSKS